MSEDKGYALVIVLVVITVLFLLSASLSVLINGEISLSANNFNRIKKTYNAETGIEESIALIHEKVIEYDESDTTEKWSYNQGDYNSSWEEGTYNYTVYEPSYDDGTITNEDSNNYKVISEGKMKTDDNPKKIIAFISPPDYGEDKAIVAGKDFNKTSDFIIDPEDYIEDIGTDNITNIYEFAIDNFYNPLKDGDSSNDPKYYNKIYEVGYLTNEDTDELKGFGFKNNISKTSYEWDASSDVTFSATKDYEGYVVNSDSDFTINIAGNKALTSDTVIDDGYSKNLPTVVIVDGNLELVNVYEIKDMILIATGDITFTDPPTGAQIINSFLYAGENIKVQKKNGEPIGHDFSFKGQIISKHNVEMKSKEGSTGAYYDDKKSLYNPLEEFGDFYIYFEPPKIVKWIE